MSEHWITNKSFVQQANVKFYMYTVYILYLIQSYVNVIRSIIIIILVSQNLREFYDYRIWTGTERPYFDLKSCHWTGYLKAYIK